MGQRVSRAMSFVVVFSMLLGIIFVYDIAVVADTDPYTGLSYKISNGNATITDFTPLSGFSGHLSIPMMLEGSFVTAIGSYALSNCTSLTSVTIPTSVTSIGYGSFYACDNLVSVDIPSGVSLVSENSFLNCTKLTSITVSTLNTVFKSVNGMLLSKSGLELHICPNGKSGSVTIPSTVTSI